MRRKFKKPQAEDVEYFEPVVEPSFTRSDIRDYIERLGEPGRSICSAIVIDGESRGTVAARYHIAPSSITRITRASLVELAEDLGIVRGRK